MKAGTSCRCFTSMISSRFLHKHGQRCGVAVQEVFLAHRPDLAIAKEAGQSEGAKSFLDVAGIVMRRTEQMLAASIATAQAAAVNGFARQFLLGLVQQGLEIL